MKRFVRAALLAAAVFVALPSRADLLPLWEVGAGIGTVDAPVYRGSDVRKTWLLPVPYLIYRGKFFKADRNGARATLFESDRMQVNLSLNATVPVSGKDAPLRSGMPDLRPTVEVGPTVDFNLWHSADRKIRFDARAPMRAAITLESAPKLVGWVFAPNLDLGVTDPGGFAGWRFGIHGGPMFNSRHYDSYFYSVTPDQALSGRPAYEAPGGYAGAQLTSTLSRRFRRWWVGAFLRYDNLAGAVFNDSPLIQRRNALSGGIAVAWVFGASSTLVEAPE